MKLGDTIVDSQTALQQAAAFLSSVGYDVADFTMTYSNEIAKRFKVTYQYRIDDVDTTEKLFLYFEAEPNGTVHLTRFSVYDYGYFSSSDTFSINEEDYAELLSSLEQTADVKAAGNSYTLSSPVWYRNKSGNVQLRASMVIHAHNGNTSYQEVYSILLQ